MRNNRDAMGRDGPSPCGVCYGGVEMEVGGELVIWSELLIKLALRTGPHGRSSNSASQRGVCVLHLDGKSHREI
jgi:hypothetical protein